MSSVAEPPVIDLISDDDESSASSQAPPEPMETGCNSRYDSSDMLGGNSDIEDGDEDGDDKRSYRRNSPEKCKHRETVNVLVSNNAVRHAADQEFEEAEHVMKNGDLVYVDIRRCKVYDKILTRDRESAVYTICADCSKYPRAKQIGKRVSNKYESPNIQKIILRDTDVASFNEECWLAVWCYTKKDGTEDDEDEKIAVSTDATTLTAANREGVPTKNHYITLTDGRYEPEWIGQPLFEPILRKQYKAYLGEFGQMSDEDKQSHYGPLQIEEYMGYWLTHRPALPKPLKKIRTLLADTPSPHQQYDDFYNKYIEDYTRLKEELKEKISQRLAKKMSRKQFIEELNSKKRVPIIRYEPYEKKNGEPRLSYATSCTSLSFII